MKYQKMILFHIQILKIIHGGLILKLFTKCLSLNDYNNPYDRIEIPKKDIERFNTIINIKKCKKYNFENDFLPIDNATKLKLRVTDTFQKIDECGYYTDQIGF